MRTALITGVAGATLAPREAVMLLRCEGIGHIGDRVVLEDAAGTRLVAADRRKEYSNVANLVRAAGMLGNDRPAVLVLDLQMPGGSSLEAIPAIRATRSCRRYQRRWRYL